MVFWRTIAAEVNLRHCGIPSWPGRARALYTPVGVTYWPASTGIEMGQENSKRAHPATTSAHVAPLYRSLMFYVAKTNEKG